MLNISQSKAKTPAIIQVLILPPYVTSVVTIPHPQEYYEMGYNLS